MDGTSEVLQNGEWTQIKNFPTAMWGGCATFVPGHNNKVYISGGYQDVVASTITDKIYAYDFEADEYELIGNTPETPLAYHGCVGITNSENQKVKSSVV